MVRCNGALHLTVRSVALGNAYQVTMMATSGYQLKQP
jgi:hypothetical protein